MPRSQILLIAFVIFVLDQLAKFLVLEKIELNESITLIPNFLALNHVNNTGIAFSLFNDFPFYLTIFITGLMFYIAYIFFISEKLGRSIRLRVAASTIRTVEKKGGLDDYLLSASNTKLPPEALKIKKQILSISN